LKGTITVTKQRRLRFTHPDWYFVTLKEWLRRATGKERDAPSEEFSIDDLISLGRLNEAALRLEERLRRKPGDHHARRTFADVLMRLGRRTEAVDEYLRVSEAFEAEGFYRKASALVAKVAGLVPADERIRGKQLRLERITRLDHLREVVVDSLPGRYKLQIERLWTEMVLSPLLTRLTEQQLRRLLASAAFRELSPGEEYVSAGVRRDELMWIISGRISAKMVLRSGSSTEIRFFGSGQVIGERALFERQPWPAIYVSEEKTTALVMDRQALAEALVGEDNPRAFIDVLRSEGNDAEVLATVNAMAKQKQEK
jgi:CRP-like cAMP-binding protein